MLREAGETVKGNNPGGGGNEGHQHDSLEGILEISIPPLHPSSLLLFTLPPSSSSPFLPPPLHPSSLLLFTLPPSSSSPFLPPPLHPSSLLLFTLPPSSSSPSSLLPSPSSLLLFTLPPSPLSLSLPFGSFRAGGTENGLHTPPTKREGCLYPTSAPFLPEGTPTCCGCDGTCGPWQDDTAGPSAEHISCCTGGWWHHTAHWSILRYRGGVYEASHSTLEHSQV